MEGGRFLTCSAHTKFLVMKTLKSAMYMVHCKQIMSESRACERLLPVSLNFTSLTDGRLASGVQLYHVYKQMLCPSGFWPSIHSDLKSLCWGKL